MNIYTNKIPYCDSVDGITLAKTTRQSVCAMLKNGDKFIACQVRNYSQGDEPHSNVVIVDFNEHDGYVDAQGNLWESAIALNYDGTGLKIYDYRRVKQDQ